jgi:hypothetical protein
MKFTECRMRITVLKRIYGTGSDGITANYSTTLSSVAFAGAYLILLRCSAINPSQVRWQVCSVLATSPTKLGANSVW